MVHHPRATLGFVARIGGACVTRARDPEAGLVGRPCGQQRARETKVLFAGENSPSGAVAVDADAGAAVADATGVAARLPHLTTRLAGVLDALDAVARAAAPTNATGATRLTLLAAELAGVVDATGAVAAAATSRSAATRLVQIAALLTRELDAAETGLEALVETRDITARLVATAAHRIGAQVVDALGSRCGAFRGPGAARLIRTAASSARARVVAEGARVAAIIAAAVAARLIERAASRAHVGVRTDRSALAITLAAGLRGSAAIGLTRAAAAERAAADTKPDRTHRADATRLIFGAARLALAATATARAHGARLAVAVTAVLLRRAARLTRAGSARPEAATAHGSVCDTLVADTTAARAAHVTRTASLAVGAARFTRAARAGRTGVAHRTFAASFVDCTTLVRRYRRSATLACSRLTSRRPRARARFTGATRASSGWGTAYIRARRSSCACFAGRTCAAARAALTGAAAARSGRTATAVRLTCFGSRTSRAAGADRIVVAAAAVRKRKRADCGREQSEAQGMERPRPIRTRMILHGTLV
jgi:hypothetical protein